MKRPALLLLLLGAFVVFVYLVWGPLLVTSAEEALSHVEGEPVPYFGERTYQEVIEAYEASVGGKGDWRVVRNGVYQSFWEGDERGYLWIVTYNAPGTGEPRELELLVKKYTGNVSLREPDWSFLPADQLREYLSEGKQ